MKEFFLRDFTVCALPLMVWRQAPGTRTEELHRHDCLEMMFVTSGAGVCIVNQQRYPVVAGDFYWMNRADTHAFQVEKNLTFYNFMFHEQLFSDAELALLRQFEPFRDWLAQKPTRPRKYNFTLPAYEKLHRWSAAVTRELNERHTGFELNARAIFLQLLIYLLRHITLDRGLENAAPEDADLRLSRVLNHIHAHFDSKLTLKELARLAGCSPGGLEELFTAAMGIPLFAYIGRYRIERGRQELEDPRRSISEIAEQLGFYDVSYFSRAFRRHLGISPRQYRKLSHREE